MCTLCVCVSVPVASSDNRLTPPKRREPSHGNRRAKTKRPPRPAATYPGPAHQHVVGFPAAGRLQTACVHCMAPGLALRPRDDENARRTCRFDLCTEKQQKVVSTELVNRRLLHLLRGECGDVTSQGVFVADMPLRYREQPTLRPYSSRPQHIFVSKTAAHEVI